MSAKIPSAIDRATREARRARLLRIALWAVGAVVGVPVVSFLVAFIWVAATGAHTRVPEHVYASGDLKAIAAALRGEQPQRQIKSPVQYRENDPFVVDADSATIAATALEKPAEALEEAAAAYVETINRMNPGAILYYEVDALGNLYLAAGAWLHTLEEDAISSSTELFGDMWRQYLHDTFGSWRTDASDASHDPGIVFVDCSGEVSRSMSGYVRVLRRPETCD